MAPRHPPIGWPLLSLPDDHGQLGYPDLAESVRQTIRAILVTRPGEQLMRPDFGAGLELLLHEPNSVAIAPSHPRTGPEPARALGATHPARSGRGGGGPLDRRRPRSASVIAYRLAAHQRAGRAVRVRRGQPRTPQATP